MADRQLLDAAPLSTKVPDAAALYTCDATTLRLAHGNGTREDFTRSPSS